MAATAEELEPKTALIEAQQIDAPKIFGEGEINQILEYIRAQVTDVVHDVDTEEGRKAIKSDAYKVARSKTLLDDAGKEYAAELKQRVKDIDANRRTIRDTLDELRDEIRRPVTEYEERIARRKAEIEENIQALHTAGSLSADEGRDKLAEVLADTKAVDLTEEHFGDRVGDAAVAKDIAVANLERALEAAKKREEEAAELEELRRKQAESEAREKEREAEDRARQEAEAKAQAKVEAAEREAQAAREAAERAQREADERLEADKKRREAEERRKREEDERRAADKVHRAQIHRAARDCLTEWTDLTQEQATSVITLIAAERCPHIKITY